MKNIITFTTVSIVTLYLAFAFITLELDFRMWSEKIRVTIVLFAALILLISIVFNNEDYEID